jgi:hypothetical protein
MTGQITPRQFHQADGVEDWRVVAFGRAPACWTLADAEGNEVDVATWQAATERGAAPTCAGASAAVRTSR